MKKILQKFIFTIIVLGTCPNYSFAIEYELPEEIKVVAAKFAIAMIGVAVFSFLLYIGLTIYNKLFVDKKIKEFNIRKDSLRTPRNIEDAFILFITKNRLK